MPKHKNIMIYQKLEPKVSRFIILESLYIFLTFFENSGSKYHTFVRKKKRAGNAKVEGIVLPVAQKSDISYSKFKREKLVESRLFLKP